ncbi:hypothetical protein EXE59_09815 [Nocardioides eburneiflavus]|uniref:Uncharacterized protein n=1 Tax=Nocardioides eburneiflavus TaxID=2518372 RepID=A0A4Z1CE82_9ACTN|nr:hypothetical protein [Nocardioides eburneiflavus]TGN64215.1 hypothetical protein EXE59_09815 [Nocardioides eburneiflavus]
MSIPSVTLDVAISGVWCEAEATHKPEDECTEIYVATDDGYPMYMATVHGHLTHCEVRAAVESLAFGRPSNLRWFDLRRSAA